MCCSQPGCGDHHRRLRGFATGQLVAFQEMGFGIAVALALDATLVRLLLIPAAMRLLGERNWHLPLRLDWLPDLQVEGQRPAAPPADAQPGEAPMPQPGANPLGRTR
jgi:RND superfamily putative drug exporter